MKSNMNRDGDVMWPLHVEAGRTIVGDDGRELCIITKGSACTPVFADELTHRIVAGLNQNHLGGDKVLNLDGDGDHAKVLEALAMVRAMVITGMPALPALDKLGALLKREPREPMAPCAICWAGDVGPRDHPGHLICGECRDKVDALRQSEVDAIARLEDSDECGEGPGNEPGWHVDETDDIDTIVSSDSASHFKDDDAALHHVRIQLARK